MNNKSISKLLIVALTSFMIVGCQKGNDQSNSKKSEDTQIPSKTSGDTAHNSSDSGGEIIDKIVEDISIKTTPKTDYVVGEEFSIEGGVIELQFEDGTTQDIPFSHSQVTITTPDLSTVGVKTVTVDYDGFKATYQINVEKQSYLVTLDLNYNGAVNPDPIKVVAGDFLNRPTDPIRQDYRFIRWTSDKAGNEPFNFATTAVNSSFTIYAQWEQEFAVYFDLDDGSAKVKVVATLNVPILMNAAPSVLRTGYQFLGWYNGNDLYDFATPITAALNLKAHWKTIDSSKEVHTVTINYNAGDTYPSISYYVEDGATTFTPSNPVIEGKEFLGWYQASQGNDAFDFTAPINEDKIIYAHYKVDFYTVNFKYVTNGVETVYETKTVEPGKKVSAPINNPLVQDYIFDGKWYSDKACTTVFDFSSLVYQDYDLYMKALKKNVFEAEYTYIDENKSGVGSSDSFFGLMLIYKDNGTAMASNGYYVSGLYYNGAFIEYVIYSSKAVNDAQLYMNLSCEYADMFLAPEDTTVGEQPYYGYEIANYKGEVNESGVLQKDGLGYAKYIESTKTVVDYEPIALVDPVPVEQGWYDKRPFGEYYFTASFVLYEGYNVIRLTTKNSVPPYDGTMAANAPMIDNIIIYTDSELSWTPHVENVTDIDKINHEG